MIKKACPKCSSQVAVACKNCKCGHSFFNARQSVRNKVKESIEVDEKKFKRRTGRVRREKPHFYDSTEFEKKGKTKKTRNVRQALISTIDKSPEKVVKKETTAMRAKRRQQRKEDSVGEDMAAKLSEEKQKIASIILAEINRKLGSGTVNFNL